MAAKTKAELESELRIANARADGAESALRDFKRKVPEVMAEKIEKYDLDLCQDGIVDFCETLGIDPPKAEKDVVITLYVGGFSMPGYSGRYGGFEFDDEAIFRVTDPIEKAIKQIIMDNIKTDGYVSVDYDIEMA